MNSFLVFLQKELREQVRTFKGPAVFLLLLLFGMASPLFAKMMPDILKFAGTSGVQIKLPVPTYLDAYAQFFKNIGQLVLLVIILVASGCVSSETSKGSAKMILTKRLSRSGFVLAKFSCYAAVWIVSYSASAAVCCAYTASLFPQGNPRNLFLSLFCMGFFGLVVIAVAVFASTLSDSYIFSAVTAFVLWGALNLAGSLPRAGKYLPSFLGSENTALISGGVSAASLRIPALSGLLLTAVLLVCACLVFSRREL